MATDADLSPMDHGFLVPEIYVRHVVKTNVSELVKKNFSVHVSGKVNYSSDSHICVGTVEAKSDGKKKFKKNRIYTYVHHND